MSLEWRALLVLGLALSCSSQEPDCNLAADLQSRAGPGATDCGHAILGGSASSVDDCVIAAFNAGTAFVAQYDRQGTDSKVVFGIAGDANGNVTFLTWDGDPSGGSGSPPAITGLTCEGATPDASPSRDPFVKPPLDCSSTKSLGRTCG